MATTHHSEATMKRDAGWFKWWGIACLIVIVLNMLGCARVTPIISTTFPNPLQAGQTICSEQNRPVVLVASKYLGTWQMRYVVSHEMTHARQMSENCKAISKRYAEDREFAFKMESEAFCNDLRLRLVDDPNLDAEEMLDRLAFNLVLLYFPHKQITDVRRQLPCK